MGELVECHSDYTYAEKPVALTWEGRRLEIVEILAQWRTPEEKRFRVRTSDGQGFELSYREATSEYPDKTSGHEWQIFQL
jgi:hypothetical protein